MTYRKLLVGKFALESTGFSLRANLSIVYEDLMQIIQKLPSPLSFRRDPHVYRSATSVVANRRTLRNLRLVTDHCTQ